MSWQFSKIASASVRGGRERKLQAAGSETVESCRRRGPKPLKVAGGGGAKDAGGGAKASNGACCDRMERRNSCCHASLLWE